MITLSVSMLTACTDKNAGSRGQYVPKEEQEDPVVTQAPTPSEAPADPLPTEGPEQPALSVFSDEFSAGEVEGNGGYFVQLGRKVYYRVIMPEGMPDTAQFGYYLDEEDPSAASVLSVYDLDTQDWQDVMDVHGRGKLFACSDGLLLSDGNGSISLIDPDGRSSTKYCKGERIIDVSSDGELVAVSAYDSNWNYTCSVYKNGDLLYSADDILDAYGFANGQLITIRKVDEVENYELLSYSEDGTETILGTFERPDYVYDAWGWSIPELIEFCDVDEDAVLTLGFYEGTGHFLSGWEAYRMTAGKAGSLERIETTEENCHVEEMNEPSMFIDSIGDVSFYDIKGNTVGLSEGYKGDLVYYDSPFGATKLENYFIEYYSDGEWDENILDSVVFDKTAFVITASGHHIPEEDVGWRYAYYPTYYRYIAIPFGKDALQYESNDNYEMKYLASEFIRHVDKYDGEGLIGTSWECVSYEVEGQYVAAAEDSYIRTLNFNDDGTVTYTKEDKYDGSKKEYTLEPTEYEYYEDYPCYYLENDGYSSQYWVITVLIGYHMSFSVEWQNHDGTPGGCDYVFNPVERVHG